LCGFSFEGKYAWRSKPEGGFDKVPVKHITIDGDEVVVMWPDANVSFLKDVTPAEVTEMQVAANVMSKQKPRGPRGKGDRKKAICVRTDIEGFCYKLTYENQAKAIRLTECPEDGDRMQVFQVLRKCFDGLDDAENKWVDFSKTLMSDYIKGEVTKDNILGETKHTLATSHRQHARVARSCNS